MTGVSRAPRASSSHRPLRASAGARLLGASAVLAAVAASACSSELADGTPSDSNIPTFDANGNVIGNVDPNGNPINPVNTPNNEGNPMPTDRAPAEIGTGDLGVVTDANGMPLPVDQ